MVTLRLHLLLVLKNEAARVPMCKALSKQKQVEPHLAVRVLLTLHLLSLLRPLVPRAQPTVNAGVLRVRLFPLLFVVVTPKLLAWRYRLPKVKRCQFGSVVALVLVAWWVRLMRGLNARPFASLPRVLPHLAALYGVPALHAPAMVAQPAQFQAAKILHRRRKSAFLVVPRLVLFLVPLRVLQKVPHHSYLALRQLALRQK